MFTRIFKNCRCTYHQRKQEHGEIITNDSCLYDSISALGGPVRNQNVVIFLMQGFKRSGMSLKPFCIFMTSCPDGTARCVVFCNQPATKSWRQTQQNASVVDKMSLPNSQGSNDNKPLHLMSKMSLSSSQESNYSKPLHLMSNKCHYRHYNSDKFALHKFRFTPNIALRIANNYGCQLLLNYLHHTAESFLRSQPVSSFRFIN
jgi:hypothetical protein